MIDINRFKHFDEEKQGRLRVSVLESISCSIPSDYSVLESIKDKAYLSNWTDNTVVLDTSSDKSSRDRYFVNLDEVFIQCSGPMSIFTGIHPLTVFPNLADTAKAFLNECVKTFSKSNKIRSDITQNFNNLVRFYIWMIQIKGVYELRALTRSDFNDFVKEFERDKCWGRLLNIDEGLQNIIARLKSNEFDITHICSSYDSPGNKKVKIREGFVTEQLGVPISSNQIPIWFKEQLLSFHRVGFTLSGKDVQDDLTYMRFYSIIKSINRLYDVPDIFDKPVMMPIPSGYKVAEATCGKVNRRNKGNIKNDGRTVNLNLDDAIKLFKESIDWIYEYAPGILKIGNLYRKNVERMITDKNIRKSKELSSDIEKICLKHGLPFETAVSDVRNSNHNSDKRPAIEDLIVNLQTACFIIIATNHGRRLNEIVGEQTLPYGLYFGCVKVDNNNPGLRLIDIYIEKTVKDWCTFYVNNLVFDAINVLEEVSQLFRPLNTERKTYESDILKARKDKLFVWRIFTTKGFDRPPSTYHFTSRFKKFLLRAGVDDFRLDNRSHPFRRFFALLYFYRYDNPRLLALQHHLRHFDPGMTVVYISEPQMRADADKINKLYKKRIEEHTSQELLELEDVSSEMFQNTVLDILQGKKTGGNWPRIVLMLYKVLLRSTDFHKLEVEAKAKIVAGKLESRGYKRIPGEHGGCNNGLNDRTRRMSNCHLAEDDSRHTENASLVTCLGCVHHDCGELNMKIIDERADNLREQTIDYALPTVVRLAAKDELSVLENVIASELALQDENRGEIYKLVGNYALLVSSQQLDESP